MKLRYFTAFTLFLISLSGCNFNEKINKSIKEDIERDTGTKIETDETTTSKSKASLNMTIDGKDYNASCNEHYLNIAKETYSNDISYSFRVNFDKNDYRLNAFQLSFRAKEKIALPYEVELNFKKSATNNKLKTHLTVFYLDDNGNMIQTSQDVGKIIITEMSEEKITMNVDTKLLLLKTINQKGDTQTVRLKGQVYSSYPIITLMNGATKEEVF
ncbi:MAG: hypothetical protein HRU50_06880 [Winogradskyella sp.]|uniref:hypothetical protein n=1 Tax=Winogradskyella sp. TaxID=1883156 RepID=UPI0026001F22|nr:hypothetical protein [Winogradskyella sp.]NRB59656.1 hypothetical protein [Winogradskyella sp.]